MRSISCACSSIEEREMLAANGLRFVRSHFDWATAADALDRLIAGHPGPVESPGHRAIG